MVKTHVVSFPVTVNGKELTAEVLGSEYHPIHFVYRVVFSDGFEDSFYILENGFVEGNKKHATPYAKALREELPNMISWFEGMFIGVFQYIINGVKANVWVIESESEEGEHVFTVRYNNDYRFELKKKNDRWLSRTVRKVNPEIIDNKLAVNVGFFIDSLL